MSKKSGVGGNSRKTRRAEKRKKYVDRFVRKYGMTRSEWAAFKKDNPQEAHTIRTRNVVK